LDFETFRTDVLRTVRAELSERDRLLMGALGISGEAGEVADSLKKMLFHGHPLDVPAVADELGDVMWYVVLLCDTLGLTLNDVLEQNVEKRRKRYPHGFTPERSINRDEGR
jgi:NTP pyrophosphatase (non-canonical NTP hydrolase)